MSQSDVKAVSNASLSATGKFRALVPPAEQVFAAGKGAPEPGKDLPVQAKPQPDLEAIAEKLNSASRAIGRELRFEVNMDSGHSVIQVLDRETGEIIREIPPEKAELSLSPNGDMNLRLVDALV